MNSKVRDIHLDRKAVVYLRQSTLRQVREHRESTNRQYALRERALQLGWADDAIEIVDEDLGRSGSTADGRTGFQRLAEDVAHGRVGALLALEVSRLARSSADWYRLLDLAGLADVLIVDEDVVYDPRDYNDRLLLGLKGQFAAAELYWMRLRLNGGRLSKARRGEVVFGLPIGYVWTDAEKLVLDPDEQVQQAIRLIFARFRLDGSAYGVTRYFAANGLQMPVRDRRTGELRWTSPRYYWVKNVLQNPLYTGAYVYGRRESRTALVDGEIRHQHVRPLPMEKWQVCLRDRHPAYVSWEDYLENQKMLRDNCVGNRRGDPALRGAAREGRALLQGLVICGRCGGRMFVRYTLPQYGFYTCHAGKQKQPPVAGNGCWSLSLKSVDEAVAQEFLAVVQPAEIDLSLAVARDADKQAAAIHRQWQLQLESARYAARLAERRYKAVDPDSRTVARTLEREWNEKLEDLLRLEHEYDEVRRREKVDLSDEDRRKILALARDLPKVWRARSTTASDRKTLLRMLIKDVTLSPIDVPRRGTRVQILWVTGAASELIVSRPRAGGGTVCDAAVVKIRELFERGICDREIAEELNKLGLRPARTKSWSASIVTTVRARHSIHRQDTQQPARRRGLLSTRGIAEALGVPIHRVQYWAERGRLTPVEGGQGKTAWYRISPAGLDGLRARVVAGQNRQNHDSAQLDRPLPDQGDAL
jgi:DNA invertase Pin-like site-specific DNA recombinase